MNRYVLLAVILVFVSSLLLLALDVPSRYLPPPTVEELGSFSSNELKNIHVLPYPQNEEINVSKVLKLVLTHTVTDKRLIIVGKEKAIIFLPGLRVVKIFSYTLGQTIATSLLVKEEANGSIIAIKDLRPFEEIYLLQKSGSNYIVKPLLRAVPPDQVLILHGHANHCNYVEVYAYKAAEDFNASQPPDPYLWLNNATVIDDRYELRIDLSSSPASRTGHPLLNENRVLLVYGLPFLANQSWTFISLEDIGEERNVTLNITCSP